MGIYASGGVEISFTKEEDANKVHKIHDSGGEGEWLYFKVSSIRVQNAEWQVEKIIDVLKVLIKDKVIGSIECFHSHLMTEYNSWDMDGEDFNPSASS